MKGISPRIKRLSPHLVNQIAAGEVVERPSSVLKELIENSIDAGSNFIEIRLKGGGKELIEVKDDGIGMSKKDLELCIEPHSTSKIERPEDLFEITTLGFRGEALSSISSVSRLSIASRTKGQDEGWRLKVDFGKRKGIHPYPCEKGTIISVSDLFLEIPARLKFLKSSQTEYLRCKKVVNLFCASWPEIGIRLFREKKMVLNVGAHDTLERRLSPLLGKDTVSKLIEISGQRGEVGLKGYIASPDEVRVSSRHLFAFLNKRPISSPLIWKAVNEALRGYIVKGNFPVGVFFLEMPPSFFDINVHPAKMEVRFEDSNSIYRLIFQAIRQAFEGRNYFFEKVDNGERLEQDTDNVSAYQREVFFKERLKVRDEIPLPWEKTDREASKDSLGILEFSLEASHKKDIRERSLEEDLEFRLIGQFAKSFILFEKNDHLFILDQHAAHEALIFKVLMEEYNKEGSISCQNLLFPKVIELGEGISDKVLEKLSTLKETGIKVEPFGHDALILKAIPHLFEKNDIYLKDIEEIIALFLKDKDIPKGELLRKVLSRISCSLAIKARTALIEEEMKELIKKCLKMNVTNCPHGRPVMKRISVNELEREFFRR